MKSVINTDDGLAGYPGSVTCPVKMTHEQIVDETFFFLTQCLVMFILLIQLSSLIVQLIMLSLLTSKDLCSKLHSPMPCISQLTLNPCEMYLLWGRFLVSCISHWATLEADIQPHVMYKRTLYKTYCNLHEIY